VEAQCSQRHIFIPPNDNIYMNGEGKMNSKRSQRSINSFYKHMAKLPDQEAEVKTCLTDQRNNGISAFTN